MLFETTLYIENKTQYSYISITGVSIKNYCDEEKKKKTSIKIKQKFEQSIDLIKISFKKKDKIYCKKSSLSSTVDTKTHNS